MDQYIMMKIALVSQGYLTATTEQLNLFFSEPLFWEFILLFFNPPQHKIDQPFSRCISTSTSNGLKSFHGLTEWHWLTSKKQPQKRCLVI